MAPLNPTIQPTNDSNYRGYSQPISVPDTIKPQGVSTNSIMPQGQQIGDRSAEYEGKSAAYKMAADSTAQEAYGDLFKNITEMGAFVGKAGVAVVKKDIEDKVYDIADRERQSYTQALEQMKASGSIQGILTGGNDDNNVPQDIQGLGDHLSTLKSARDGGKISSTYYESRLLSEAKKLRAQYPGFRNEIDQEFAKVTGSNPANAYIRALTSDINRNATSAASEIKKAESFVLQRAGYPNADKAIQAVRTGQWGLQDAVTWAAPYEQEDFQLTRQNKVWQSIKNDNESKQLKGKQLFDQAAGIAVGRSVDTMTAKMGINTAEDASRLDTAVKNGIIPQQQWVAWGQELAAHKTQLRIQMNKDAAKAGLTAVLGQDEVNKRIEASLQPLTDMADRIYNKDIGGYYRMGQDLKGMNEETQKSMLSNPKIGPFLQVTQALKEIAGEQNVQSLAKEVIKGDFPNDLKTYYTAWQKNFATQFNMRTSGVPVTFNDVIDDLKAKNIGNKRLNVAILDQVSKVADPTLPEAVRLNFATAAFSPQNRGMISKLSADTIDSRGNPVTGQAAVFQKFTSPEITKAMFELGKKDPQAWKNYTDWAQETIGSELANRDINTLAQIRNPAIRVAWDSDNKRLVPTYDERPSVVTQGRAGLTSGGVSSPGRAATDSEFQNVQRVVNRMNGYLGNYKNIAEAAGIPVDAFLLKTISTVNPEAVQNMNGIPYNLMKDIGLSQMKGIGSK